MLGKSIAGFRQNVRSAIGSYNKAQVGAPEGTCHVPRFFLGGSNGEFVSGFLKRGTPQGDDNSLM